MFREGWLIYPDRRAPRKRFVAKHLPPEPRLDASGAKEQFHRADIPGLEGFSARIAKTEGIGGVWRLLALIRHGCQ